MYFSVQILRKAKLFLWVLMWFSSSLCLWFFKISQARVVVVLLGFLIGNISKVLISDNASFSVVRHTKNDKWQMRLKLLNFHLSETYLTETYLFFPSSSLLSVYLPNLMCLLRFYLSPLGWFYSMGRKEVPPHSVKWCQWYIWSHLSAVSEEILLAVCFHF